MTTIDQIDFSKLKPYEGNANQSFEQLCYQIALKKYGHLGRFTPIEGSGGDSGVEFFLELTTGKKWGWQCKFFGGNGRLNEGSRKKQIADSLETACRNHPNLDKWILCLKTDLTVNSKSPKGVQSYGEQHWFKNELPNIIPKVMALELELWDKSTLLEFLGSEKHIGIRTFFFGELEFSHEWFKSKFEENFIKVKDKYDQELHSIDRYTQTRIDFLLLDNNYCKQLDDLKNKLNEKLNQIEDSISEFRNISIANVDEKGIRDSFLLAYNNFQNHIQLVFEKIAFIDCCFKSYNQELLSEFNSKELDEDFNLYYSDFDFNYFNQESHLFKIASDISYQILDFGNLYHRFFYNYFYETCKELHFLGDAAKGKTHISCDIVYKRINEGKPGIFITGDKFTEETNLTAALKKILDVNQSYTFDEFLQALNIYGSISKCKVPIVIDSLNEATLSCNFSSIWKNHLGSLIAKILQLDNLVVITTCRTSYSGRIWEDTNNKEFIVLDGFDDYETVEDAVNKYFKKYKLKADLLFSSIERFQDPIFLKIFCELKMSVHGVEVEVNIEEESMYDVFKEYFNRINKKLKNTHLLLRRDEQFVSESLLSLSSYLWVNNVREIPLAAYYKLIDGDKPYEKDNSKADILLNEGLLVARDMRNKQEYVSFTYDILAGFMISESLIYSNKNINYFTSYKFIEKIIYGNKQHPLFEDVITSLCLLLPQLKKISIHELIAIDKKVRLMQTLVFKYLMKLDDRIYCKLRSFANYAFGKSIISLFKLPSIYLNTEDCDLMSKIFIDSIIKKEIFFDHSFKILGNSKHPFNAIFLSNLLNLMPMNQRDISWTEYIRKRSEDLEVLISNFELQCKNYNFESEFVIKKQHVLSNIVVWFLTSTNRRLRDLATRALYFYGRKFPIEFSKLVYYSLKINDPYVWERTLAALYGVTMAEHNSLKSDQFRCSILPEICINIYNLIFKDDAEFSTTHVLARDYARRIIEIALLYHPLVLTQAEIVNIIPPYKFGGLRDLGEYDYGDNDYDYSGPIHMDFSNYTLGRIVRDGHSYSNPPEKIKVRKQIYWRIFDLGWNAELFELAEKSLGNDNFYNHSRNDRARIERYGKKYSWIAFYENTGLRLDNELIDMDWDRFRISDADIEPSFPLKSFEDSISMSDILGDRQIALIDWYRNGGGPFIDDKLILNNIAGNIGDWICLDGYCCQEDIIAERRSFVFFRSFFVKDEDYLEFMKLLEIQDIGGRWLPEVRENYYTYSGELYCFDDSTYSNYVNLNFSTGTVNNIIGIDDPKYLNEVIYNMDEIVLDINEDLPEEIEIEDSVYKEFKVLLPVMEYSWESYHSHLNDAGNTTVVSKEVANSLGLINQPQTFDLFDSTGAKASLNVSLYKDYENNHRFVYLRRDLFDDFLAKNNLRFVWAIWGERELSFRNDQRRSEFFKANDVKGHQAFQKIVKY